MAIANLIEKKWLWRSFHILTSEGVYELVYDGKGLGYEEVLVNGEVVIRMPSYWWYVPKFDFSIGNSDAQIYVEVSALMQISFFKLVIDGIEVYSEGQSRES
jgi:hypothetical protein